MMQVMHNTHASGGDTVNLSDDRPMTGYVISIYPELEHTVPRKDFTVYDIMAYVCDNIDILKRDNHYLGTWVDKELVYFDISVTTKDLLQASMMALEANQLAIYDILEQESVYLNELFKG